jgi:hypothetical protein
MVHNNTLSASQLHAGCPGRALYPDQVWGVLAGWRRHGCVGTAACQATAGGHGHRRGAAVRPYSRGRLHFCGRRQRAAGLLRQLRLRRLGAARLLFLCSLRLQGMGEGQAGRARAGLATPHRRATGMPRQCAHHGPTTCHTPAWQPQPLPVAALAALPHGRPRPPCRRCPPQGTPVCCRRRRLDRSRARSRWPQRTARPAAASWPPACVGGGSA